MKYKEGQRIEIQIGEHVYTTPPVPAKKDILYWDRPADDQYWRRQTDFPKVFYDWHNDTTPYGIGVELDAKKTVYENKQLISLSVEDTAEVERLQKREQKRIREGVWFFNNGEPTYLTGDHYDVLQWLQMLGCLNDLEFGSNYGQYLQFQRDMAYYFEICKVVEYARGGLMVKSKKTGMTQFFSLICLSEARKLREKLIGMMSITEDLCKDSVFKFIAHAIEKIPPILLPSRSKQNLGEVIFGAPNSARNPLKKRSNLETEYLNTTIKTVPTIRTGFDSFVYYIALIDEFPKIKENTYPKELFEATLVGVMVGITRRIGTVFGLSYVPETTDRSFREARQLYKDSKLRTRAHDADGTPVGATTSKLLCHTLVAQEGLFGCCDKFGKPILEKVWAAIKSELDDCKGDPLRLQAVKRQYPTNESDPWQETNVEDSFFDNLALGDKLIELEELESVSEFPYKEFDLEFEHEPQKDHKTEKYTFSKVRVRWVTEAEREEGKTGRFRWYRPELTPDWFMQRHINQWERDRDSGLLKPRLHTPFFISADPTKYRISKHTGKGSTNSFQAFILPNAELNAAIGKDVTNKRMFIHYYYRANRPAETLFDLIKLVLYLGAPIQIESNVSTWATRFIEMGVGGFALMLNEDGALEPYEEWKEKAGKQKLFVSLKATIDQYFDAGIEHIGPLYPGEINHVQYIDCRHVVEQLMSIKKDNTLEYDAAVAYLEGLMGINAWLGWRRKKEDVTHQHDRVNMSRLASTLLR